MGVPSRQGEPALLFPVLARHRRLVTISRTLNIMPWQLVALDMVFQLNILGEKARRKTVATIEGGDRCCAWGKGCTSEYRHERIERAWKPSVLIGRMIQGMRIPLLGQQAVGAVVVRVEGAPGRTVV